MNMHGLQIPEEAIKDICLRHGIRRLALFGSAVRGELRPDSDIDVLVEFLPGKTPGLKFFALQDELSRVLRRKVDLSTPQFLSPDVRRKVEAEAEVVFANV